MNPQILVLITGGSVWSIGILGLIIHRNMIQICVSLSVMESAIIIVLVALSYVPEAMAPILQGSSGPFTDPLPQALALTAIVIGAGILAIALSLTVAIYRTFGTTDLQVIFSREHSDL